MAAAKNWFSAVMDCREGAGTVAEGETGVAKIEMCLDMIGIDRNDPPIGIGRLREIAEFLVCRREQEPGFGIALIGAADLIKQWQCLMGGMLQQ